MKMIGTFQGGEIEYHSFDAAVDDPRNYYPAEFLNTNAKGTSASCAKTQGWLSYHIAQEYRSC